MAAVLPYLLPAHRLTRPTPAIHIQARLPHQSTYVFALDGNLNYKWFAAPNCLRAIMAWIKIPLIFGTLKVKSVRRLRSSEAERRVPVLRLGKICLVWWPKGYQRHHSRHSP